MLHQWLQPTFADRHTVRTLPKPGSAGARRQRERAVHDPDDIGNRDRRRLAQQPMPALGSASAFDDAVIA
jgi:hypothetical protein